MEALQARIASLETLLAEKQQAEEGFLCMQAAVNYSLNGIAIADLEGNLNYVNQAFVRLWGYDNPAEVLGRSAISFWDNREQSLEVLHKVQKEGFWSGALSGLRKDGTRFTSQVSTVLFTDSSGTPAGILASFLDLKTEEMLQEIETRYRELFENMISAVVIYEPVDDGADFIIVDINPASERLENVRREEVIGRRVTEVFPGIREFGLLETLRRVWVTGTPEHHPVGFYEDKRIRAWRENQIYKLPSNQVVAVYNDVTERKRIEENLRFFALAVEHSSDAIGMSTPEGKHYYQNKAFSELFGDVGENPLLTRIEDHEKGAEILHGIQAGNPWRGEVKARGKNGEILDILMRAYAIKDDSSEIRGLVGLITDITVQRRSETELRETQKLLEAAVAQSPSGILIAKAPDVTIQSMNPAFAAIHGDLQIAKDEKPFSESKAWQTYRPDGSVYPLKELPLFRAIQKGEATFNEELIVRDTTGKDHWVNVNAAPIRDEKGDITSGIVIIDDITNRKQSEATQERLQAQLAQAQKMESVGRLAGGVAHDFNNMLMVISGYAEMALQDLDASPPVQAALNEIRIAAARSADITRQLLAFTRKQASMPIALDLNSAIEGLLSMLRRLIGENIEFVWRPCSELWPVYMDPAQINQILVNLCVNARDAIVGNGKITVETNNILLDKDYCATHEGFIRGKYASFTVTDTGCGMDEATMKSIFEPFFTTKEADKGTGLGMATVYGIVKQNNGFINVYSEPALGTAVKIYLPRHEGAKAPVQAENPPQTLEGCGETILFVEDEPSILKMGHRLLGRLGYNVLATCSPGEAIRMAREHEGEIDLLITDMVMPEMNGRELSEHIRALHPKTAMLFMSGYTAENIAYRGLLNEEVHFIQKPFSVGDFAQKIHSALQ